MLCNTKKTKCTRRPDKPALWHADPDAWLNTNDITNALNAYQRIYPNFLLAGVVPSDFFKVTNAGGNCIYDCNFDLKSVLNQGKTVIAWVINLDKHGRPGSHWVVLAVDTSRRGIFYYDSTAEMPLPDTAQFAKTLQRQAAAMNLKLTPHRNTTQHQHGNTECGVFSMNFIAMLLETKQPFAKMMKNIGNDQDMLRMRDVFFLDVKARP